MDIFSVLSMLGGLSLFLFGMSLMGQSLERRSGFVWSDILTDLERVSDHCSNIAGCVTDMAEHNLNVHSSLRELRRGSEKFDELFRYYGKKYSVAR